MKLGLSLAKSLKKGRKQLEAKLRDREIGKTILKELKIYSA